jgi:hypothetical protein
VTALAFASSGETAKPGDRKDMPAARTPPQHEAKIQHEEQEDSADQRQGAGFPARPRNGKQKSQHKDDGARPRQRPPAVVGFPGVPIFKVRANLLHAITPSPETGSTGITSPRAL